MKNLINKISIKNNNKLKKTFPVILLLLLITIVTGVTYAIYNITLNGGINSITTGLVSMSFTESTNVITIEDALPISDVEGKTSDNYFDFSVTSNLSLGQNDPNTKINYSIEIEPLIEVYENYSYNKNATEEQINQCTISLVEIGLSNSEALTFCSGGEFSGLTIQDLVDSANAGDDDYLLEINIIEPSGVITINNKWNFNQNATEEQINQCTVSLVKYVVGVSEDEETYNKYKPLCEGEEVDGLSAQTAIDSVNSGDDDYLEILYILEPSGVVSKNHEWTVKKNATEEEINKCTLWWLEMGEITEEDEDYEEVYTAYSELCTGKPFEEADGLTLQYIVDYQFPQMGEQYLASLAKTGIIEYRKLENLDKGYLPLKDNNIKLYLENITTNEVLIDSKLISDISNYELYSASHTHTSEIDSITTQYRLRAWIDYDTDASNWNEDLRYEYKFRVNINGDEDLESENVYKYVYYDEGTINREVEKQVRLININYKYTNDAAVYSMNENATEKQINQCITSLVDSNLGLSESESNKLCSGGTYYGYTLDVWISSGLFPYDVIADTGIVVIDTAYNSGDSGVFLYDGTDDNNENYPIYYYRGNIDNNNVIFANMCWKIVRTTSTGGTKLIYNGVPSNGACNNTGKDSIIGQSKFNSSDSPAYVGYMYGDVYEYDELNFSWFELAGKSSTYQSVSSSTTLGGGKTVTYSNGTYIITDYASIPYSTYKSNYNSYKGYYMCDDYSSSCSTIRYIENVYSTYYYYVSMTNGETYENLYQVGDSKRQEIATYVYGNDVTYSNGVYTLKDTIQKDILTESETLVNGYHYTCLNASETCSSVYYITYFPYFNNKYGNSSVSNYITYLTFTGGDNLDAVKDKMFINTTDSTIKTVIDTWYSENLKSYTNMLENTIFCNDRTYTDRELDYGGYPFNGGTLYSKDGNSISVHTSYANIYNGTPSLQCSNINDRFSLSVSNGGTSGYGNNALKYPVALLTLDEANLAGGAYGWANRNYYLYSNRDFWFLSPAYVSSSIVFVGQTNLSALSGFSTHLSEDVRPSISLKLGTTFTSGNGEPNNPYVVG